MRVANVFLGIDLTFARYNRLRLNDIFDVRIPLGPAKDLLARVNVTEIGSNIVLLADEEEIGLDNDGDFNNATRLICLFHHPFSILI